MANSVEAKLELAKIAESAERYEDMAEVRAQTAPLLRTAGYSLSVCGGVRP